ncbi:Predicted ester cyclase [Rhizobiales bacterium GAS191]|nr:Predicted ester cyclase [Rhizobiales bacterium GAS113]SEE91865.1 Predicted ester cyclase [Rhizobiales bacterium GAS191]
MINLNRSRLSLLLVAALSAVITLDAASALAADLVRPEEVIVAGAIPPAERDAELDAARAFYDFWNTNDAAFLKRAISDDFSDRTLPPGRPQGREGPAFASRTFRGAVPDLKVTVHKMIVAGPYVTVHMTFAGHFTGNFETAKGNGQPVSFVATDLLRIRNGRITDNWHVEDNLTLLQQMGIANVKK